MMRRHRNFTLQTTCFIAKIHHIRTHRAYTRFPCRVTQAHKVTLMGADSISTIHCRISLAVYAITRRYWKQEEITTYVVSGKQ